MIDSRNVPGHRFIVEYQVIRLSEVDGASIIEAQQPGLMPFTPLMKPPTDMSAIDDLQRLSQLMDEAAEAEHLENFIHALETYTDRA